MPKPRPCRPASKCGHGRCRYSPYLQCRFVLFSLQVGVVLGQFCDLRGISSNQLAAQFGSPECSLLNPKMCQFSLVFPGVTLPEPPGGPGAAMKTTVALSPAFNGPR